jgi:NAD(P)-dependent dehydrogenase (short-subunit alcohol dehydrogenase family)
MRIDSGTRARLDVQAPLGGSVALVTGGGQGLGAAICRALGAAGAAVVPADLRADLAVEVAARIRDVDAEAVGIEMDVTDRGSVRAAVAGVLDRFGRIDVLVNNAGTDVTAPFEELAPEDFDRVLDVNLRGPVAVSREVFPAMRERGGGHIVNVASTASKRTWANATAYHASKWGLLGFSHALHVEGRAAGIRVTAVVAGGMRTPFILDRFPDTPLENLQDPEAVAETVRFVLCQPPGTVIPEVMVIPMGETSWP